MSAFLHRPGRRLSPVRAALLDRFLLVDEVPDRLEGGSPDGVTVEQVRAAVRRDLEALLNARLPWRSAPDNCRELQRSPYGFGIPDIAGDAFSRRANREAIRETVAGVIARFEPRLTEVRVMLRDEAASLRPALRLRIDATLLVDPAPEPYALETTVNPPTSAVRLLAAEAA